MADKQLRVLKGIKGAGRFAGNIHTEGDLTLGRQSSFPNLEHATADQIRDLSHSHDASVLAELTSSPAITDDVLERLAAPSQATSVRLAAAHTGYAGTADRASHDRNPFVRAVAAHGWDISDANRDRLHGDRTVQRVLEGLAA